MFCEFGREVRKVVLLSRTSGRRGRGACGIVCEDGRCPGIVLENISLFGNSWLVINEAEPKSRTETMTPTPPKVWVSSKTISLLYVDAVSWVEDISRLQEALSTSRA